MTSPRIFIIYPSARPEQVATAIKRAVDTTSLLLGWTLVLSQYPPLRDWAQAVDTLVIQTGPGADSLVGLVNRGYQHIIDTHQPADADFIGYWSDDFYPEPGWLETMLQYATPRCLLQPEDRSGKRIDGMPECATVPFGTRSFWEQRNDGHFFNPAYKRWWCDCEIVNIARRFGEFFFVRQAVVEHKHWSVSTRHPDAHDVRAFELFNTDKQIYLRHRRIFQRG